MHQKNGNAQTRHSGEQRLNAEGTNVPTFVLTYSFNYSQFDSSELQDKARSTLTNFISFVAQTFDGLLENGKALRNLYLECISQCENGKKIFNSWLDCDFGASRYVARSAMEISTWFEKLPPKIQRFVRQHVQKWSVAALRELSKVSESLVKEVVISGKKTAAQIKQLQERNCKNAVQKSNCAPATENSALVQKELELVPGTRVVVTNENTGWNGQPGIITSVANNDEFWVLLDHTVAQGMLVNHLLKSNQIRLETQRTSNSKASSVQMFTAAEVEIMKAEAVKQYSVEKAELEQARFLEIKSAALEAAKKEIIAYKQHAQKMTLKAKQLIQQLTESEREIKRLQDLVQEKEAIIAQMEQQTLHPDLDLVISSFGEIAENLGWNGWRRSGYRDQNGTLHKGISAISAFVLDLTREYNTTKYQ